VHHVPLTRQRAQFGRELGDRVGLFSAVLRLGAGSAAVPQDGGGGVTRAGAGGAHRTASIAYRGTASIGYRGTASIGYRGTASIGYRGTVTIACRGTVDIPQGGTVSSAGRIGSAQAGLTAWAGGFFLRFSTGVLLWLGHDRSSLRFF
jgi:hypothetical protein